jgi:hypothetical protein
MTATSQIVQKFSYAPGNEMIAEEIDLSAFTKGVYILEVNITGMKYSEKIILK